MTKQELQQLPEFLVLPPKLRNYILFTELWSKPHGTACRLLKLNKARTKVDPRVTECQSAIRDFRGANPSAAGGTVLIPHVSPTPEAPRALYVAADRLAGRSDSLPDFRGAVLVDEETGQRFEEVTHDAS